VSATSFVRLVRLQYSRGEQAILTDFSLDVIAGEFIALLGRSGSGKTTVLRLIAGLDAPDSGEVWLRGELASQNGRIIIPPRLRQIGFVFQELALWPHMTIGQSLAFVLGSDRQAKERTERISEILSAVHIPNLGTRFPHQLSGGERQRAALARALVPRPRLLLLDEPMSSLDADLKSQLVAELLATHRTLGLTTVYVTHDISEVSGMIDRVIRL
jgi:ABC-type Fe3+/spermidine/putrescine transport system ATPase subunit